MNVLKVPLVNGLGKTKGCEEAPDKIAAAIKQFYISENLQIPVFNTKNLLLDQSNVEQANKAVFEAVKNLDRGIIIGGDHSVTYPCFKAFAEKYKNPGLVVFDAHPDMEVGTDTPTHEDFIRFLIEEGSLKPENIVLVGLRNMSKNEMVFLKEKKIKYCPMKFIASEGKEFVCDEVMSFAKDFDALYLSIDIDVLDPAFAPGTGYLEPGGLSTRELLYFLQRMKNLKNLKLIDVVEVNPSKDLNDLTVKTAAKLIVELNQ